MDTNARMQTRGFKRAQMPRPAQLLTLKPKTSKHKFSLPISFTPIFLWYSTVTRSTYDDQDRTDYFFCSGVVSSSATGDTFPVPSCLEDRTVARGGNLGGVCEVLEQWPWGMLTLFVVFMTGIYCYKFRKEKERGRNEYQERLGSEQSGDEDATFGTNMAVLPRGSFQHRL